MSERPRSRAVWAAGAVAVISTASAYSAMVGFARDAVGMSPATAVSTAGVLELSLVTAALMAREAAQQQRPGRVPLALTWLFSGLSGVFAAWHELHLHHPAAAAGFRLVVPLLAALLWHLALVGDRHLASGLTWRQALTTARVHRWAMATEDADRARAGDDSSPRARRRLVRAERAARRARSVVLRTVPPGDVRGVMVTWTDALTALSDATVQVVTLSRGRCVPGVASVTGAYPAKRATAPVAAVARVTDRHGAARRLREAGHSVPEIARHLGVANRTVQRWLAATEASSDGDRTAPRPPGPVDRDRGRRAGQPQGPGPSPTTPASQKPPAGG